MSKLSQKAAREIAGLFNSIDVAGMMKDADRARRDEGTLSAEECNKLWDLWEAKACAAAQELYSKYGITPIGFSRKVS
jgi:hypothetical protein